MRRIVSLVCIVGMAISVVHLDPPRAEATALVWRVAAGQALSDIAAGERGRNLYVVGQARVPQPTQQAIAYLAKLSPTGETKWRRTWKPRGSAPTFGDGIAFDPGGFVYWVGTIRNSCGGSGWFIRKVKPDGHPIWTKKQRGWHRCRTHVEVTDVAFRDGLLVMSVRHLPCCFHDFPTHGWTAGFSVRGQRLWRAPFQPPGVPPAYSEIPSGVAIGSLGQVYVTGWASRTAKPRGGTGMMVIEKLTSTGAVLWRRSMLRLNTRDTRFKVAVRGDLLMVAGSHIHRAMWLGRLTIGGSLEWSRSWGSRDHPTWASDVTIGPSFQTWVVGGRNSRTGGISGFVRRYSEDGGLRSSKIIDERGYVSMQAVVPFGKGVAVAGEFRPGVEPYQGVVWKFV
jgi:hypothetical protein